MRSEGPPDEDSPIELFSTHIIEADGEWVETDELNTSAAQQHIYRIIGMQYAEVSKRKGIMYGRMRKDT